ncbi:MAG: DMT family transporter [Thermoplasmata archaeon]
MTRPRSALAVSASALSAVALWGLAFPLIQDGLEFFSPVMLGFVRFALASALVLAVVILRYKIQDIGRTIRSEWKPILMLGLLYVTIPNIAQNIGLEHGTSSIASVIQSSGPVMTLLFAALILKEGMTQMKGIGTVVAMAGTVLLVASGGVSPQDEDFVSNLLIFASATSYGLAWVSAKRMLERNPPLLVIGLSLGIGTLLLGLVVLFEASSSIVITTDSLVNIATLGFLCAGASSVLYLGSLEHEEVSRTAFFIYLMPVFASAFAWIIRGEGVEVWTAVCGVIIVAGIVIAHRDRKSARGSESSRRN